VRGDGNEAGRFLVSGGNELGSDDHGDYSCDHGDGIEPVHLLRLSGVTDGVGDDRFTFGFRCDLWRHVHVRRYWGNNVFLVDHRADCCRHVFGDAVGGNVLVRYFIKLCDHVRGGHSDDQPGIAGHAVDVFCVFGDFR